ncbi:MAG: hypothetical protein ACK2U5_17485, partial [Candidatus Promineifilaceae bacterium]
RDHSRASAITIQIPVMLPLGMIIGRQRHKSLKEVAMVKRENSELGFAYKSYAGSVKIVGLRANEPN